MLVAKGTNDNNPVLVRLMALRQMMIKISYDSIYETWDLKNIHLTYK